MFDPAAMRLEEPRYVTFNSRTDALSGDNTLEMAWWRSSEDLLREPRIEPQLRTFIRSGPTGDTVYPEGATHQANRVIRGSQSTRSWPVEQRSSRSTPWCPRRSSWSDHALVRSIYKGATRDDRHQSDRRIPRSSARKAAKAESTR